MSKTIRFIVLSACLALSALFITGANAQLACEYFGIDAADCELISDATENTKSAGAIAFTYTSENIMNTGFFDSENKIEGATGVLVFDEDGLITSARIDIENITSTTSFSDGANAVSFILVDGIAYIGVGEDLDSLVWEQLPDSVTERSFYINSLISMDSNPEAAGLLTDTNTEWTRNEVGDEVVFAANIADVDPFALADAAELEMLGGMTGNMNASLMLAVNTATNTISTVETSTHMTYSFGSLDASSLLGEEQAEMSEEEMEMFGDLFSGLMSDNEQVMSSTTALSVSVEDVDTSVIVAPAEFEATADEFAETISYIYADNPLAFIAEYYTEYSMLHSFSFDFGGGEWDFGSSWNYYSGMCAEGDRAHAQQDKIGFGDTVSGNLASETVDVWTFDANEGDVVTIQLSSDAIDSYLELVGADSTGLISDDDGGGYPNAQISQFEITAAGTYSIFACSYSSYETGAYTLSLNN